MAEKQTVQVVTTELTPRGTVSDQVTIALLYTCLAGVQYIEWAQEGLSGWHVLHPFFAVMFTVAMFISVIKAIARHQKRKEWKATMNEMQEYIAKHSQGNM